MTKWITKKLGEGGFVDFVKGEQINGELLSAQGQFPMFNGGIEPSGYLDKYNTDANQIIMSEGGNSCGYINYIEEKFWRGGHCYLVKFKDETAIEKQFFYYLLKYHEENLMKLRVGSGLPNIQKKDVFKYTITYPESLIEQHRIAGILSSADGAIAASEALIAKYRNIKRGLLATLLQPKEGWKKVKLGECCEIGDGLHGTPKYDDTGEYYFINGNNIKDGIINIKDDTEKVDEEVYNKHKIALTRETILMSINGTIGNLAYYNDEKVVLGKSVAYFMIQKSIIIDYLYYYLQSCEANNYFDLCLTGSTIKNLGLTQLRDMTVYIPDLAEQHRIAGILSSVDAKIAAEEKVVEKYKGVKKGLMGELLKN